MIDHHDSAPGPGHEIKVDDPNLAFIGELVTLTAKKITWATVGRATDPGRYMFRFGWLTITADDLAIWQAYPNAAFTLQDATVALGGKRRRNCWRGISSRHI